MFILREPSSEEIESFLSVQRNAPFSYAEVGASRRGAPSGYAADHNRVRLGAGEETFLRARDALRRWSMFDVGWVRVFPEDAPIEAGETVAVLARLSGLWSLNACRVVYRIEDEEGALKRHGFAYGTLPAHAERGEERFTLEWDRESGEVHYDLFAFSRPAHPLVWAGYPLARALQRRFARDSLRAMISAAGTEPARRR